ncbi:hypothetical protein LTS18_010198, partial [Coniosporium uncinatum]
MPSIQPLQSVCLSCRLRLLAAASRPSGKSLPLARALYTRSQQHASSRSHSTLPTINVLKRSFTVTARRRDGHVGTPAGTSNGASLPDAHYPSYKAEEVVRQIRQIYGDTLPKDSLSAEELRIYERLYGPPITQLDGRIPMRNENGTLAEKQEPDNEAVLLKDGSSGDLEE